MLEISEKLRDDIADDIVNHRYLFSDISREVFDSYEDSLRNLSRSVVNVSSVETLVKIMRDLEELNDWRMTESDPNYHKAVAIHDYLSTILPSHDQRLDDMAMMIRRLVQRVNKLSTVKEDICVKALDYLKRKGFFADILREDVALGLAVTDHAIERSEDKLGQFYPGGNHCYGCGHQSWEHDKGRCPK